MHVDPHTCMQRGMAVETYAIANQKGGVGKTTITLALAGELARRGAAVLVVDLDPQASATKVLGVDVDERPTVADVMLEPGRFSLGDVLVATEWGFTLAPAETALASRESRRATADEFVLRRHLHELDARDVVLIDCPPSLGLLTINALTAASQLIVVTEPSFLALQGIKELLDTYDLIREHYNHGLELAGVIVNRWERTIEHRRGVAEIERYFGDGLAWQPYLPKRTALQDAARRGVHSRARHRGQPRGRRGGCEPQRPTVARACGPAWLSSSDGASEIAVPTIQSVGASTGGRLGETLGFRSSRPTTRAGECRPCRRCPRLSAQKASSSSTLMTRPR
jgi:chromosome partitioning protein